MRILPAVDDRIRVDSLGTAMTSPSTERGTPVIERGSAAPAPAGPSSGLPQRLDAGERRGVTRNARA